MPSSQSSKKPALPKWLTRTLAVLGALGILGAIGTTLFRVVYEKGRDILTVPLSVHARVDTEFPVYIFPASARRTDAPVDQFGGPRPGFARWAEKVGGIPYLGQEVELVVRGRDPSPVVIDRINLRVVDRKPLTGQWANVWECGGIAPVREMRADLREGSPRVRLYLHGKQVDHPVFTVSSTDPEIFDIRVSAGQGVLTWVIELDYTSAGRSGTYTVKAPQGKPFVLAGGGHPRVYGSGPSPNDHGRVSLTYRAKDIERLMGRDQGEQAGICW